MEKTRWCNCVSYSVAPQIPKENTRERRGRGDEAHRRRMLLRLRNGVAGDRNRRRPRPCVSNLKHVALYSSLRSSTRANDSTPCPFGAFVGRLLIVSAPPRMSPAYIAGLLKGHTAKRLREKFPSLKTRCGKDSLWTRTYYVGTAGAVSKEIILRYINERQEK